MSASTAFTSSPCTIHASSRDSPIEDGQPMQCIPSCIRMYAIFSSYASISPIVVSFVISMIYILPSGSVILPGIPVSWFPGFFRSYNIIITVSSIIASLNLFFSFSVLYPLRQQFPFFPCSTFSSHKYNTGSEGSALRSMRQDLPDIHLQNLFFLQQT